MLVKAQLSDQLLQLGVLLLERFPPAHLRRHRTLQGRRARDQDIDASSWRDVFRGQIGRQLMAHPGRRAQQIRDGPLHRLLLGRDAHMLALVL